MYPTKYRKPADVDAAVAALSTSWSADAVDAVQVSGDGLMSDIHGDAAYRANLFLVMAKRAVVANRPGPEGM